MAKGKKNLPEKNANELQQAIPTIAAFSRFGPLPDAEEFARYEQVCPGAADRIIAMAENQSKHRQEIENRSMKMTARDSLLGLIFAFIFALATLAGGLWLVTFDHPVVGTIFGGVGLGTVVTGFIKWRIIREATENKRISQQ